MHSAEAPKVPRLEFYVTDNAAFKRDLMALTLFITYDFLTDVFVY